MTAELCVHDLAMGSCTICLGDRPAPLRHRRWVRARYAARCPGCGGEVVPGDLVTYVDDRWCCCLPTS